MKKSTAAISLLASLSLSFNMCTAIPASAAQLTITGLEDGSFLEKDGFYYLTASSSQSFKKLEIDYYGHYANSDAHISFNLYTGYYNTPVTSDSSIPINPYGVIYYAPYYDTSTGSFEKNNLVFTFTHANNTKSTYAMNCNVLGYHLPTFASYDTTFYYTDPTHNSIVSSKTYIGAVNSSGIQITPQMTYNCLAYALHAETGGWLWPFGSYAGAAAVTYYLDGEGYSQNITANHNFCHIIAYGSYDSDYYSMNTRHFAKVTDWSADGTPIEINSKWGTAETVHSTSITPFTSAANYGTPFLYFNKKTNNNASICYNPATNTYYDSNYKTWNSATQSYEYIDTMFSSSNTAQSPNPAESKECSKELSEIYQKYAKKIQDYKTSIPSYEIISYVITDDGNGAADELITSSIPYFDQVFDIATQDGYTNFNARTAQFIINNALHLNVFYSQPDKYLSDVSEQFDEATATVKNYGSNISRADCSKLQEKYGYLIAPALKDIGKLEYLTIEKMDACQDIDALIDLCELFA